MAERKIWPPLVWVLVISVFCTMSSIRGDTNSSKYSFTTVAITPKATRTSHKDENNETAGTNDKPTRIRTTTFEKDITNNSNVFTTTTMKTPGDVEINQININTSTTSHVIATPPRPIPRTLLPAVRYSRFFEFRNLFGTSINPWRTDHDFSCNLLHLERFKPCCGCEKECKKYGTCCLDLDWQIAPGKMEQYLKRFEMAKRTTCQPVLPSGIHETESVYMLKRRCNKDANESLVSKCLGTLEDRTMDANVPVLGNNTYIYPNKYCAICNNVTEFSYINYSVSCAEADLTLKHITSIEELSKQTECIINIQRTAHNEPHLKKCVSMNETEINTSAKCSHRDKQLCFLYQALTSDGKYKNPHCRKCIEGGMPTDQLRCPQRCDVDFECYLPNQRDLSKYATRFTLSFNGSFYEVSQMKQKFPIWKFYNLSSSSHEFGKDEGFEQYLCSGRRYSKCCSCKKDCMTNGRQCCIDIFWDENNPVDIERYQERFMEAADRIKDVQCAPVLSNAKALGYSSEYADMVKSCPRHASLEDTEMCLIPSPGFSPTTNVPVYGSDGILYANSFCAKCNFVHDYQMANLSVQCQPSHNLEEQTTEQKNSIDLQEMRNCSVSIQGVPKCKSPVSKKYGRFQNSTIDHLCRSYSAPLSNGFNNYHCLQCSEKKTDTKEFFDNIQYCDPKCNKFVPCSTISERILPIYFRWSFVLRFSGSSSNVEDENGGGKLNCKENEIFDITTKTCTKFTCPKNYQPVGLKCTAISNIKHTNKEMILISRQLISHRFVTNMDYRIYTREPSIITLVASFATFENFTVFPNGMIIYRSNQSLNYDQFKFFRQKLVLNVSFIIAPNTESSLITKGNEIDFSRSFSNFRVCAIPIKIPLNSFNVKTDSVTYKGEHFNFTDLTFFTNSNASDQLHACRGFHLSEPCPRKTLTQSDVLRITENLTLITKSSILSYNEYVPVNNGYQACILASNESIRKNFGRSGNIGSKFATVYIIEHYITYIGTSISIICYCWIISTYVLFKDLRTVPGLNTCFMCLSLLIADLFFLVSIIAHQNNTACTTFAVIIHWGLLAAFIWVLIICFDLVKRFGSVSLQSQDRETKRMYYRAAIAFLTPAVTVASLIGLDQTDTVDIGYGRDHICWITNRSAKLFSYVLPTALILLISCLALIYTVYKIVSEKQNVNKRIHHATSKTMSILSYLKIAVKLAMILGLVEIFGYIQTGYQGDEEEAWVVAFGFLYTVCRSFRGLMLWFVYIYGGAVAKRYRKHFGKSIRKLSKRCDNRSTSAQMSISYLTSSTISTTMKNEAFSETGA